jgi:hypothetical protein
MSWLPATFTRPTQVEVMPGHHLRPIRATDVDARRIRPAVDNQWLAWDEWMNLPKI